MKTIIISFLICLYVSQIHAQYDSVLAKKLNADDYGMKQYILVMLKKGSSTITDKKILDSIFRGHMANIQRLADEKKLVVAGPVGNNDKNYEGVFVFNTSDTSEARKWFNTDPAIQSKHLEAEMYEWYCSAALMQVDDTHKRIQKKSF